MQDTPKTTMAMIRALYPNPVRCDDAGVGYCVLGAAGRFASGSHDNFPVSGIAILTQLNPRLGRGKAALYASDIMGANDRGRFTDAWDILDDALSYR